METQLGVADVAYPFSRHAQEVSAFCLPKFWLVVWFVSDGALRVSLASIHIFIGIVALHERGV